jgi:thiamine-monophosphate kinase
MRKREQMRVTEPASEAWLLRKIAQSLHPNTRSSRAGIRLGIGDDAALWKQRAGYETLLTCDWFLEDVHFLREKHPADAVGWKCLARAVSDIAAMGGQPRCFLLSLAIPPTHTGAWLEVFLVGLRKASRRFHCAAAGGDTTRSDKILINITVVGEIKFGHAVLRTGARPGDQLFVSGRLGEAELGLREVQKPRSESGKRNDRVRKHLYPEPRVALGAWLAARKLPTAMLDLSDGLSTDLPRLCAASGVGALVEEKRLPLALARGEREDKKGQLVHAALNGGDDYELLFCVPPNKVRQIPRKVAGISVTRIGELTSARGIRVLRMDGSKQMLDDRGWDPFRAE